MKRLLLLFLSILLTISAFADPEQQYVYILYRYCYDESSGATVNKGEIYKYVQIDPVQRQYIQIASSDGTLIWLPLTYVRILSADQMKKVQQAKADAGQKEKEAQIAEQARRQAAFSNAGNKGPIFVRLTTNSKVMVGGKTIVMPQGAYFPFVAADDTKSLLQLKLLDWTFWIAGSNVFFIDENESALASRDYGQLCQDAINASAEAAQAQQSAQAQQTQQSQSIQQSTEVLQFLKSLRDAGLLKTPDEMDAERRSQNAPGINIYEH